jgi:signal peptidase II
MKKFKLPAFGFVLAVIVIALDQLSKSIILALFHPATGKPPVEITLAPFFDLVLVWNKGVSFGIFNHDNSVMPWALIGLALVLVILVAYWLTRAATWGEATAFGLIIGGALGNVIDRARLGAVVDFLDFHVGQQHWPAFNVADSCIVLGACLILYLWGVKGKTTE